MANSQLYQLTQTSFRSFSHLDWEGNIATDLADNIPMIYWPDRRWCLEANIFIQRLYKQGLSRKNGGGTLTTYAAQLSHLIRFCFKNKIDFHDLMDNHFTLFIKTLSGEKKKDGTNQAVRGPNAVRAIGKVCLDFLSAVGDFYGDANFIGPTGRILASKKTHIIQNTRRSSKPIIREYWHHNAFPTADSYKSRLPVSTENVRQLREVIQHASSSVYLKKRRYVLITLLEITGARRFEVAHLTVQSVLGAEQMEYPMLKVLTGKKGGNNEEFRLIPVLRADLNILLEFVRKNRAPLIKRTCGARNDNGILLVNERTGQGLRPNTITQEISLLRLAAGIRGDLSPHLFRHAFVTNLFIALIEREKIETADDFRRALLDGEALKREVREWTGHTRLESLEPYIHIAFALRASTQSVINQAHVSRLLESVRAKFLVLKAENTAQLSSNDNLASLESFLNAALADISHIKRLADS